MPCTLPPDEAGIKKVTGPFQNSGTRFLLSHSLSGAMVTYFPMMKFSRGFEDAIGLDRRWTVAFTSSFTRQVHFIKLQLIKLLTSTFATTRPAVRSLRTGPRGRSRAGSTAGTGTEQSVTQTPAELVKLVFQTNTVDGISSVCK